MKAILVRSDILRVGTIAPNFEGGLTVTGWHFHCKNRVPMYEIDEDGNLLFVAGWSISDLQEISSRPSEWV